MTAVAGRSKGHALVGLATVEADRADVASQQMATVYGDSAKIDYNGRRGDFAMRIQVATLGEATLARADIKNWSLRRNTDELVNILVSLDGRLDYRCGATAREALPSQDAAVGRPAQTIDVRVAQGRALSLYLPIKSLTERAERLTGKTYGEQLVANMVDRIDLSTPTGMALSRHMKTAMVELVSLHSIGMGALAASAYEDLLLTLAATCLFPQVAAALGQTERDCGPAAMRRARDYIKEHAAEPLDLSRLARELGLAARTMQENFQRHFGHSARDYVRECRLENARQQLLLPNPNTSVTQAALSSGFSDLGHFSAKYRAKFGELPSETLRAAQRIIA